MGPGSSLTSHASSSPHASAATGLIAVGPIAVGLEDRGNGVGATTAAAPVEKAPVATAAAMRFACCCARVGAAALVDIEGIEGAAGSVVSPSAAAVAAMRASTLS